MSSLLELGLEAYHDNKIQIFGLKLGLAATMPILVFQIPCKIYVT